MEFDVRRKFNVNLLLKKLTFVLALFAVLFCFSDVKAANLSSLEIEGYNGALTPAFDPNTYEYTAKISNKDIDIYFNYEKENSSDTVTVKNNKHIKDSTGTVTIDVSGTKYKINYTKVSLSKNYVFSYTGAVQTFNVPLSIQYKLETWGARGGAGNGATGYAGKGAYAEGEIGLINDETIYVYVGQAGGTYGGSGARGGVTFNGGGSSYSGCNCTSFGNGGGATDFRLVSGSWNDFDSLKSRIMVAGGGGASGWWNEGGYTKGGAGGNLTGQSGNHLNWNSGVTTRHTTGGTQTSGGKNNYAQVTGGFGTGGSGNTGAGGGYYGGGNGQDLGRSISGAAGGSSFISGYEGCDAITADSTSSNIVHTGESIHYSNRVFTNMTMASGDQSMPTFDGTSTMTGNSSNGYAKVTPLSGLYDNDNYLETLESDNGVLSPSFDPTVTEYTLTLDKYDQDFTLTGERSSATAMTVGLDYTYDMRSDDQKTVDVTVISESGNIKIYSINVVRPGIENGEHSSKLKQLDVAGYEYDIDPKFNGLTTEYDIEILSNETDLDIVYRTFDKDAKVTVTGNRNMMEESGTVTVTVEAPSVASTVYRINWTRIEVASVNTYGYTGNYQTFVAPITGNYQIELWGARGGEALGTSGYAGKGAYTKGSIKLAKGETLYIYTGQAGGNYRNTSGAATFNGGGSAYAGSVVSFGTGGGATDVRLNPGVWNDFDSLKSRIMVAGGGGGSAWWDVGGYTKGGAGGNLTGGSGIHLNRNSSVTTRNTTGGTQTSGGKNNYAQVTGTFGIGGGGNVGAGGGYYGGGNGQDLSSSISGAGGGSSFISGYEGCNAIYKNSTSNNIVHTGQSIHYSNKVFTDMVMASGDQSMPTFDGTSTMTGNSSNGYAKITPLFDTRDKNNYLFDLTTDKGKLSPVFDTLTQEYTIRVDGYTTSITLDGEAYSDKASVSGLGEYDLTDVDSLDVDVAVTAENGDVRVYTVHIKKYAITGHSTLLKKIYLTNYPTAFEYDSDTAVYNAEIPNTEIELPVSYIPFDEDATVKVTGDNFNSVRGKDSGVITIVVEAPECEEKIYKINWTKVNEVIENEFGYTGSEQTFTATKTGYYKLETWGAQGGNAIKTYTVDGGYGGYSTGITKLNENDKLFINIGGQGQSMSGCSPYGHTGYNGGGYGACISNSAHAGGGGATHIATVSGLLKNLEKYKGNINSKKTTYDSDEILIVSGAGGGAQSHSAPATALGGAGGGYIGGITNYPSSGYGYGTGGTQLETGHYVKNSRDEGYNGWVAGEGSIGNDRVPNIPAAFGQGKNYSYTETSNGTYNGGGAGWYGGYSSWHTGGAGGSGYIGSSKLISTKTSNKRMVSYNNTNTSNEEEIRTISTTCTNATATTDCTKKGDGYAKITFVTAGTDNYLLDLRSDNGTLSPSFDPEKNEYNLVLDPYIPEFTLSGELSDENASVAGLGKYEIEGTSMDVEVAVTSISGDTRIYTVHVTMEPAADRNIKLKKLKIEDYVLTPKFHPLTEEYTVEIGSGSMYVDVEAIPFDSDAKVTIEGNGYLPTSKKNTITITVEKDGVGKTVYKVNVEREGSIEGEEYDYSCTGEYQEFVAPATTYYKIEAWGAAGGYGRTDWSLRNRGGLGAYTSGEVRLTKGQKIYIYVGCQGQNGGSSSKFVGGDGGWNGGAKGGNDVNQDSYPDAGGGAGGASDIRLVPTSSKTKWNEFDSLKSRIMVAAGGGGGNYNGIGGAGGTINGTTGYGSKSVPTQTSGYAFGYGMTGMDQSDGSGGGAGGYFGGYTANYQAGGGGSSYVSGCDGCLGIEESSTENNIVSSGESIHYSGYAFDSIKMLSGEESMPNPNGGYSVGNNGDGKVIITAGRDRSADNYLSELSVDKGTMSPEFDMQTLDYNVTVGPEDYEITISAKLSDDTATVIGTGTFDVEPGTTTFPVVVTAENGDIRTYNVNVTREKSSNSKPIDIVVSGLVPSLCALNPNYCGVKPVFNPNTNKYDLIVPARIKQLEFTVIKGHKYQTVEGDGIISLEGGSNTFDIKVTSEDGSETSTYTYEIIRDMTGDTTIEDLKVIDPSVNINFDPDLTEYYFSIPNEYGQLELEVTLEDPLATYEIIGNENFQVGLNLVTIRVTAQNGETKDYVLSVYREKSGNVFLNDLKIMHEDTEYELSPSFNKVTTSYVVNVPNEVDAVNIVATPEHPLTTISGAGTKQLKTGTNTFDVVTTSENGTTEVYKVAIIRAKNSDATLKQLDVAEASLDPEFDKDITEYSFDVGVGISNLNINAIPTQNTSKVTISGNSGFKVGKNTVNITVTAEDGTKKVYILNANRIPSTNNYLTALTTDKYDLLEEFDKETLEYNITLENDIKDITVSAIKEDNLSKVSGLGKYNLKTGNNDINVVVTSEDGITRTYTLHIFRKLNSNANLLNITNNVGKEISPEFDKSTTDYTMTVDNLTTSISVVGIPEVNTSYVEGNGTYDLIVGENNITFKVVAEDSTEKEYRLKIIRKQSDNANLESLNVKEGLLEPTFNKNTTEYTVKVLDNVTSLTLNYTPENSEAKVEVIGNENFIIGNNLVKIKVTSEDGTNIKEYNINVIRQEEGTTSSKLSSLSMEEKDLTPDFSGDVMYYTAEVPYTITTATLEGELEDVNANVVGLGQHSLIVGENILPVKVTSTEGIERVYQVVVTRLENDEARLSNLTVDGSNLSPTFNRDIYEYSLSTQNAELDISATPIDKDATVEIIGNSDLQLGDNTVTVRVTAKDKHTTRDYTLHVTKEKSNNNNLAWLEAEGVDLTPEFSKTTTVYYGTVARDVNSIQIDGEAEDEKAVVEGLGETTLAVGQNYIEINVVSESGKIKKYTLVITRTPSSNNYLASLTPSVGLLDQTFDKEITDYEITVPFEEKTITFDGYAEDDNATVSGLEQHGLSVGENIFNIVVTSEGGTSRTYKVKVIREEIVSSLLESLKITNYTISPDFDSEIFDYNITVDNEVESLNMLYTTLDRKATVEVEGNSDFIVGLNTVNIKVTDSLGNNTSTYTLNVNRQPYSNTFLAYIAVSKGELKPLFDKKTLTYDVVVENSVDKIKLDAEAEVESNTVEGIGTFDLEIGNNKLPITVTSPTGVKRTYYVNVYRSLRDENYLLTLQAKVDGINQTIDPEFDKETNSYTINVDVGTGSINFIGTISEGATVDGLGEQKVKVGENNYSINVTSESGKVRTYNIKVNRKASSEKRLANLIPSEGTLSPTFTYINNSYTLKLDSSVNFLSFEYTTLDQFSTVTGAEKQIVPDGNSVREITVTAEDGTTETYTINVLKDRADEARLKSLTVAGYDLTPVFDPDTKYYTITVPNSKKSLLASEVDAIAMDSNAKISKGSSINLSSVSQNLYTVVVTAKDGFTTENYYITVVREKGSEALLSSLKTDLGDIEPNFDSNTFEYTLTVPNGVERVTASDFLATATEDDATITKPSKMKLQEENNVYKITVVSGNKKSTNVYKINIERSASSDATLMELLTDIGKWDKNFNRLEYKYTINVGQDDDSIIVNAKPNSYGKVLSGTGKHNLPDYKNKIEVTVQAEDGTIQIYELNVVKSLNSSTKLEGLSLGGDCDSISCPLEPTFDPDTLDYEVLVTNEIKEVSVEYIKKNDTQKVKVYDVDGNEIDDMYTLKDGENLLRIEVESELGTSANYTIYISKEKSKNNYLKELSITDPDIETTKIDFDKDILEYYVSVPHDIENIELNAIKAHSKATVKISGAKNLKEGNNDIIISVQAENGDIREYIIHTLRENASNNYLESITVSSGVIYRISPTFNKGIYDYVTTVPANVSKINLDAVAELDTTTVTGTGEKILKTGFNSFDITSTSKEGTVATYHVVVNKLKADKLYLKSLDVKESSLDPEFDKETFKYDLNISSDTDNLTINAVPEDDDVDVKIVGNKNLVSGNNTVYIVLSNKDKTVTTTYTLNVLKEVNDNNYLKSIKVNDNELMSEELREETTFETEVEYNVKQISLKAIAEKELSKIIGEGTYSLAYGENIIKLNVISESGNTREYTIKVTRKYNNDLFMISTDKGELSPSFDKDTLDYYVKVDNDVEEINIIAVALSEDSTIEGNGYHKLTEEETIIYVKVSSSDNSSKTYRVHVFKEKSSNALLENLYVHEGVLDPEFDPNTENYTVKVASDIEKLTIDYEAKDKNATVEIIGNEGLKIGENTVKVKVTAQDSSEKIYTIKVIVQEQEEYSNKLKSLTTDVSTLIPDFDPSTYSYTVTVNNDVNTITLTGVLEDVFAKAKGLGKHNLELGRNELPIVVTSKDGKTRTYSVIVYRIKSSDARLKLISFKEGQISPLFDKDTHMYTMTIDSNVSDLTETIEPLVSGTTYEITGNHSLALGENIITITSTAADLETKQVYTIKVTKEMSADNFLESLETNIGKVEPNFSKDNTGPYIINVDDTVNSLILSGKPVSSKSTVTGLGVHQIKRGSNNISVIVTSEIGTTRTYTVIVNKALNSDNSLYLLKTSDGDLEPEFDKDILEYTVKVDSEVSELTVLGLATNSYAKVDGNGKYTLNDGVTTISLTVTAEDGKKRIYKLNVEKEKEPSSKIMELNVHEGVLSPTFDKNTLEYSITVPNEVKKLTMDIKLEDSDATYIVEGNNDFKVGSNQVFIKVTSKNNVVTTYTLNVIRQTASNNYLKSLNTTYDITPAFNRTTQYYEIEVEDDIASIEVNGEAEDSRSTVTGFGTYDLAKGDNYIYITVTSASGVDRIYTVKVTRKLSSDNKLSKLSVNTGDLNPLFNPDVNNYKIDIASGIEEINIEAIPNNINAIVNGSGLVSVKTGENLYEIIVTAEDGSTNVYKIEATKNSSNNTNIENIIPSSGVLSPNYSNSIDEYEVEVEDDISLISFDVVLEDSHATVSGNKDISLNYGNNDVKIKVQAEDGTEKIVNINVIRNKDITEIDVEEENILMAVDDIYELKPIILPEDATNKEITYSSGDSSIVTVENDGKITSHKIGETEVTIASKKNPHIKKVVKVTVLNLRLESDVYDVRHNEETGLNIVIGADEKTTLSEIQSSMKNNDSLLKFYDLEANEITDLDNTYVATGQIITLEFNGKKYDQAWIVLRGDNTEDSSIDVADYNELRKQVLGKNNFEGYLFKSVDVVEDDEADVADYNTLKQYLLGKIKSLNNLDE